MKIAIPVEQDEIFQHFGHSETFRIYTVEDGRIVSKEDVGTGETGHEALAGLLADRDVEVLICGGIGGGAVAALEEAGLKVCGGVGGDADTAAMAYLDGSLEYSGEPNCDHHHDEEGGCSGDCGGCSGHCMDMWEDNYVETRTFTEIVHLTRDNFETEVLADPGLICIDFWATWCEPCKMMAPVFAEVNDEQPRVKFCKVDVDEQPELAQVFGVQSIPTIVVLKARRVLGGFVGVRDKSVLTRLIEDNVK